MNDETERTNDEQRPLPHWESAQWLKDAMSACVPTGKQRDVPWFDSENLFKSIRVMCGLLQDAQRFCEVFDLTLSQPEVCEGSLSKGFLCLRWVSGGCRLYLDLTKKPTVLLTRHSHPLHEQSFTPFVFASIYREFFIQSGRLKVVHID